MVEELERRSLKYKGQLSALYARGYTLDRRDPRVIVDDGLSMQEKFEAVSLDYELSRAILFGGSQSGKRAGNNVLSRENWRKNTQAKIEDVSKMHLYDAHVKALVRSKALLSHGTTGLSLNRRIGEISLQPVQDLFYEEISKTDSKTLLPSQQ